jgi:hypothetical protein
MNLGGLTVDVINASRSNYKKALKHFCSIELKFDCAVNMQDRSSFVHSMKNNKWCSDQLEGQVICPLYQYNEYDALSNSIPW